MRHAVRRCLVRFLFSGGGRESLVVAKIATTSPHGAPAFPYSSDSAKQQPGAASRPFELAGARAVAAGGRIFRRRCSLPVYFIVAKCHRQRYKADSLQEMTSGRHQLSAFAQSARGLRAIIRRQWQVSVRATTNLGTARGLVPISGRRKAMTVRALCTDGRHWQRTRTEQLTAPPPDKQQVRRLKHRRPRARPNGSQRLAFAGAKHPHHLADRVPEQRESGATLSIFSTSGTLRENNVHFLHVNGVKKPVREELRKPLTALFRGL